MLARLSLLLPTLLITVSCAASQPAKSPSQADGPDQPRHHSALPQVQSEVGSMDEAQVRSTFERLWKGPINACLSQSSEFVAGSVTIRVRVTHEGHVKWVYLKDSSLGDRSVERCILQAVRSASWPQPEGGEEGLAEQELPVPDRADRPAVDWSLDQIEPTVRKAQSRFDACRKGSSGAFRATIIVQTNGSVLSAGVSPPDENSEESVDCVVDVLKSLKFPSTGSWPAKATFDIP